MAKYEITHRCGHISIETLFGKRKEREWLISKLKMELCKKCQEEEYAKQNQEAAKQNKENGLPPLKGTEKQVAWAESIRLKKIIELNKLKQDLLEDKALRQDKTETVLRNYDKAESIINTAINETDAVFWIEGRNRTFDQGWLRDKWFEKKKEFLYETASKA